MKSQCQMPKKWQNNSGIILFVVLWTLVVLTVLAIGLGRSTNLELMLTKNSIGKLQSRYLAWGGVMLARDLINEDSAHEDWGQKDTLYQCGVAGPVETLEPIFKEYKLGDGYVSLHYQKFDNDNKKQLVYGIEDEERKININALSVPSVGVLQNLIASFGYDEAKAEELSFAVMDWVDPGEESGKDSQILEEDIYKDAGKNYLPKNRPFDSLEELSLVVGMDEKLYKQLKNYLTVFPKDGGFKVNMDTASKRVLLAVAKSKLATQPEASVEEAQSLVDRMIRYRAGDDQIEMTSDDQVIEPNAMGLIGKEQDIFLAINEYRTQISNFFHVRAQGVVPGRSITTTIDAVISRDDLKIISWHRE